MPGRIPVEIRQELPRLQERLHKKKPRKENILQTTLSWVELSEDEYIPFMLSMKVKTAPTSSKRKDKSSVPSKGKSTAPHTHTGQKCCPDEWRLQRWLHAEEKGTKRCFLEGQKCYPGERGFRRWIHAEDQGQEQCFLEGKSVAPASVDLDDDFMPSKKAILLHRRRARGRACSVRIVCYMLYLNCSYWCCIFISVVFWLFQLI
jgi:hypothetical protein